MGRANTKTNSEKLIRELIAYNFTTMDKANLIAWIFGNFAQLVTRYLFYTDLTMYIVSGMSCVHVLAHNIYAHKHKYKLELCWDLFLHPHQHNSIDIMVE